MLQVTFEGIIAAVGAFIGLVAWAIRLEAKTFYNGSEIGRLDKGLESLQSKHDELETKIVDKLSTIEKSLAKIEGRLSINKDDK